MSSLNPVMRIRDQMLDGMIDHGARFRGKEAEQRVGEL